MYQALYRKYRPQTFDDVVGQLAITQTLKTQLQSGKLSHAYLFTGSRGTGKTSSAKILAKAVNCENPQDGNPCNCCKACLSIDNGSCMDVLEIDAASNNGVDNVRDLRDDAVYTPSQVKMRVYIIDEVHMLSISAFNALLKIIEEPPEHLLFILATTELHKVPATILSRCQRFAFRRIGQEDIAARLQYVAYQENIDLDDSAARILARLADGGMRDALSILDQVSIYNVDNVSEEDVDNVTGRVADTHILNLVKALHEENAYDALNLADEILESGKEAGSLISSFIKFCRSLLLYKNGALEESTKRIYNTEDFINLSEEMSESKLFYFIDVMINTQNKMKHANSQKVFLEIALLKIVDSAEKDLDLLGKIKELENKIGAGVNFGGDVPQEALLNIDNKIKRINSTIEKHDITGYKEFVNAKLSMLEEVAAKFSALPDDLNNRLENLEEYQQEHKVDNVISGFDIASIDEKINQKLSEALVSVEKKEETPNVDLATVEKLVKEVVAEEIKKLKPVAPVVESANMDDASVDQIMELISNTNDNIYRIEEEVKNQVKEAQEKAVDKETLESKLNDIRMLLDSAIDEINKEIEELPKVDAESINSNIETLQKDVKELKDITVELATKPALVVKAKEEAKQTPQEEPRKRVSPFEIDRDSVEFKTVKETTPTEEPKESGVKTTPTTVVIKKQAPKEETKVDETSKIYDVKIVERILHQAREAQNRERKVALLEGWNRLDEKVGNLLAPIARLLKDGKLTANGTNELLIVYPSAGLCNQLMMPKAHENAKQILKITFGRDYDFMALPENVWQEKRLEYHGQYSMGNRTPRLSPINNPELKIIITNSDSIVAKKSDTMQFAESLFGADFVEKENE